MGLRKIGFWLSAVVLVGDEAARGNDVKVTLYGQEKDSSTADLARMNMILHDYATAEIKQGNTLANPLFTEGEALKTFDYVVANPPFSDKRSGETKVFKGGVSTPMSHNELTAKYNKLCDFAHIDKAQADRIRQTWMNLQDVKDINDATQTIAKFGNPRPLSDKTPALIS